MTVIARLPIAANLPAGTIRVAIMMLPTVSMLPLLLRTPEAFPPFLLAAVTGCAAVLMARQVRRRIAAAAERRPPLSEDIADHHYRAIARSRQAALDLEAVRMKAVMMSLFVVIGAAVVPFLSDAVVSAIDGGAAPAPYLPATFRWVFAAVAAVSVLVVLWSYLVMRPRCRSSIRLYTNGPRSEYVGAEERYLGRHMPTAGTPDEG